VTERDVFSVALHLSSPWRISGIELVEDALHLYIDFERTGRFNGLPIDDTVDRQWRHADFFQYQCILHAKVPRVKNPDGKVSTVEVPWARPGSGFTHLFEFQAITLMRQMPVRSAANRLRVHDTLLWRMLRKHVLHAHQLQEIGHLVRIGVDETASRRGHEYITVFVDLDARRVLFGCQGRSGVALAQFRSFLESKGVDADAAFEFVCDMSPAFLSGIAQAFPNASVTLDKFHLVAMMSKAVDDTRKEEAKRFKGLQGTKWLWLRNPSNLSERQKEEIKSFLESNDFSLTAKAYGFKLQFQELFAQKKRTAQRLLDAWLDRALESGLQHVEKVATTFFKIRELILNWFDTKISNGTLEGLHSVLQATKNKARGYKDPNNLITMSYLLHGKLDRLPL
jgi:transposase